MFVYTIQPVVKPVWQPVVSCIQTFNQLSNPFDNRFDSRLYRVFSRLSNRLYNPVWQPVERTLAVRSTRLSNPLYNRFDNWLYRVNGVWEKSGESKLPICKPERWLVQEWEASCLHTIHSRERCLLTCLVVSGVWLEGAANILQVVISRTTRGMDSYWHTLCGRYMWRSINE